MSKVIGVIPARLESRRLFRKLLLNETGKPLLQHTWENARGAVGQGLDHLVISTDSAEISSCAKRFGAEVVMTGSHCCGSDRAGEAVQKFGDDFGVVVVIQGDEPEVNLACLGAVAAKAASREWIVTLVRPPERIAEFDNRHAVKALVDSNKRAIGFSRRKFHYAQLPDRVYLHIGIYAYNIESLKKFAGLSPSMAERHEGLEQLRALEAGIHIHAVDYHHEHPGIDTYAEYEGFVKRFRHKARAQV